MWFSLPRSNFFGLKIIELRDKFYYTHLALYMTKEFKNILPFKRAEAKQKAHRSIAILKSM